MAKCPSCGREMEAGRSFCSACGEQSPAVAAMIHDARQALASNPDDTAARYNLAIAYKLGGMDDMAMKEFELVAGAQPDFGDAFYEMGLIHAKRGHREEAIAALVRARELDPDNVRAFRLLERLRSGG